jgi:hypothetical protein
MNRVTFMICLALVVGEVSTTPSSGDSPRLIAGRSIAEYTADIDDSDRVVRLRAIKSLGAFGAPAGAALRDALDHGDAAVRYTAAVQLGRIGGDPLQLAEKRLTELASDPSSHAVRMAASYALCESGKVSEYLPLLVDSLDDVERGMACSAAELIGRLGPAAQAAEPALETTYQKHRPGASGGDYHIGGAAMNALRKIRADAATQ